MKTIKRLLFLLSFLFVFLSNGYAQKQKVIFDCDLGDDIDDAYALALLLSSDEFDILGVVLDYGNTPKRAQIACRMLYETGREDIPVVVGRKTKENYSNQFYWGEGFDKVKPISQSAADFIIEKLRQYPHEVILFTVGPVPNMADVLDKDPEALKLTKKIYSMFGSFYVGYNKNPTPDKEWNVEADVEASKKFMACGADMVFAGLDVTGHVKFSKDRRLKLLFRQSPLTNAISGLNALWEYESRDPTLYDPVAIGMVLWPELFKTERVHVSVTDDGYTVIDKNKAPNCTIGISIETEKFLKRIVNRYLHQNLCRE